MHRLLHAVDLADGLPFRRLEGQAQEVQKRIQAEWEEEKLSPLVMDPQAIPIHEFIVSQIIARLAESCDIDFHETLSSWDD